MSAEFSRQAVENRLRLLLEDVPDHGIESPPFWLKECHGGIEAFFALPAVIESEAVAIDGLNPPLKTEESLQAAIARLDLSPDVVADERKSLGQEFTTGTIKELPGSDVEAETHERLPVLEVEHPDLDLVERHHGQPLGAGCPCGQAIPEKVVLRLVCQENDRAMTEDSPWRRHPVEVVDEGVAHQGRTEVKVLAETNLAERRAEAWGRGDVRDGQDFRGTVPPKDVRGVVFGPEVGKLFVILEGEHADLDFAVAEIDRGDIQDQLRPRPAADTKGVC
jgi:hypothetical protein